MSYSIMYDSLGIYLPKNNLHLCLVKMGDNNVYNAYGKGRARDWSIWSPIGNRPFDKELLRSKIFEIRNDVMKRNEDTLEDYPDWNIYDDKSFGYFASISKYGSRTSTTSFKQYYNFFIKDKQDEILFEDFVREYSINVGIEWYSIPKELESSIKPERTRVHSEDELLQAIKDYTIKYSSLNISVSVDIPDWVTSKDILRRLYPDRIGLVRKKKVKEPVEVEEYWTIVCPNGAYYVKKTKYGYKYSFFSQYHKFATEKDALRKLRSLKGDNFSIKKIENKTIVYI